MIAEIFGNFFIARNVELNDSDTNSIAASSSDTTKAGNSVSSASVSNVKFDATPDIDYTYDDNGNRISKTDGDDTTTYSYDFLNRLTEITYDDGTSTKFFYDALSRKFKEQELDSSEQVVSERRFVYDGFKIILELNSSNETVAEYVYGLNLGGGIGGILFKKDADGHYFYYNYDGRGDVVSITDEGKNTVANYEYSAYGSLLTKTGTFSNDFLYSTKPFHDKSGLYYFGYRFYDHITTCWISRDPASIFGGFNLYQNVGSNPLSFIDPLGLCAEGSRYPGYWDRYLQHVDAYAINVGPAAWALVGGLWPKSWSIATGGRPPLLGSRNPLTSVPRSLGIPGSGSMIVRTGATSIGILTVGVGFYNIGVFVGGFVYAAFPGSNGLGPDGTGGLFAPNSAGDDKP